MAGILDSDAANLLRCSPYGGIPNGSDSSPNTHTRRTGWAGFRPVFYHLRVSRIGYAFGHRVDQPNLPVYFPQKQGACVSGQSTTIETTNHVPASKPLELHNVRGTLRHRANRQYQKTYKICGLVGFGGCGPGNPLSREPEAIAWDVKNDRVFILAARDKYGAVVDPETYEIDEQATQTLRESYG